MIHNKIDQSTLGTTYSVCEQCRKLIPAKIVCDEQDVYFVKFCPDHGESRSFVRSNVEEYLAAYHYLKPAWVPESFEGNSTLGCPDGCGFCEHHEQHLCMPIIEITSRCNLACPVCINASGESASCRDMTLDEFCSVLDKIMIAEKQIDVLNLSGGEPFLHPEVLDIIDAALSRPEIARVSISTNGLLLLKDNNLLKELKKRNVVISLQMDGFDDRIYQALRGRPLLQEKRDILKKLKDLQSPTSLIMTVAGGINDDQFPEMLDYLFANDHIISFMIQPVAFTGRGAGMKDKAKRITIPDVTRLLGEAGNSFVKAEDFVPLPCSHPLCFSLAFYLMLDSGQAVSVNKLVDAATMMDSISNRVIFGLDVEEYSRLKEMIYELWSGPKGA
ncbi:radical SAM protein, partial [Planctomycetota bacterium]